MSGLIDQHLSVHVEAIRRRGQRTQLLASNIANVDTPGYKARDLAPQAAFGQTLDRAIEQRLPLAGTHARHVNRDGGAGRNGGVGQTSPRIAYRVPDAPSLDGNTVDKDLEQARFAENALRYQASLRFLQNRVGSLIRSLKSE